MENVTKKEIMQRMEELKNGAALGLKLGEVFGGGYVFIELNPAYPEKGHKKYLMRWGKGEAETKVLSPFLVTDKAKSIAGWVSDRAARWLPQGS